jgi:hypothetical protein
MAWPAWPSLRLPFHLYHAQNLYAWPPLPACCAHKNPAAKCNTRTQQTHNHTSTARSPPVSAQPAAYPMLPGCRPVMHHVLLLQRGWPPATAGTSTPPAAAAWAGAGRAARTPRGSTAGCRSNARQPGIRADAVGLVAVSLYEFTVLHTCRQFSLLYKLQGFSMSLPFHAKCTWVPSCLLASRATFH